MFKFIHTADVHLDSPLRGLERYDGAPVQRIRGATRQALKNLVALAMAEEVELVLIAGDLYDGDWKDYNTGLFFAAEMSKLREAGIKVYLISGNHDAASQIHRQLRMPDNVYRLSSSKPETLILEHPGVALHGQGFARPAVSDDLSAAYPLALPDFFNIGLLHTSATGREGHAPYAPCTVSGLIGKGYDYWALGHVHSREILCERPLIVFPGNIQGRHIRETGAKGCTLVTVEDGQIVAAEHRELDVLRWCLVPVDVSGHGSPEEVIDAVGEAITQELAQHDEQLLAVRLDIQGSCKAHHELIFRAEHWANEIRMTATDISGGNVWIEKIKVNTVIEANVADLLNRNDAIGGLLRSVRQFTGNDEAICELLEQSADLLRRLPVELQRGEDAIDAGTPEGRREIMENVREMLIARLLGEHL